MLRCRHDAPTAHVQMAKPLHPRVQWTARSQRASPGASQAIHSWGHHKAPGTPGSTTTTTTTNKPWLLGDDDGAATQVTHERLVTHTQLDHAWKWAWGHGGGHKSMLPRRQQSGKTRLA